MSIKHKTAQYILSKYNKFLSETSESITDVIIKREDCLQAIKNIENINEYFDYFFKKIILILETMHNDFDVNVDYSGEDIEEQIKMVKSHLKKLGSKKITNKYLKKVNVRKYKKAINKWYAVNNAVDELPKIIEQWNNVTDGKMKYKDIDIEEIINKMLEAEIYKKSFEYYKKSGKDVKQFR